MTEQQNPRQVSLGKPELAHPKGARPLAEARGWPTRLPSSFYAKTIPE